MMGRDITDELVSDEEVKRGLRKVLSERYNNFKRAAEITAALSRYGFGRLGDQVSRVKELKQDPEATEEMKAKPQAVRFRLLLESLGPTFIKLGQMLAVRPDLIDDEFAEELGNLRDAVPPETMETIKATLEAELGGPVDQFFDDFPTETVAAASIGQVLKARVKGTDEWVAVKVQRANILKTIKADVKILKDLSRLLSRAFSSIERFDPEGTVEEFGIMVVRELDYTLEARNIQRLADNMAHVQGVRLPKLYLGLSTGKVLTMEYVEGFPLDELDSPGAPNVDKAALVEALSEAFIKQIFIDGFFHADPHHGNLLVNADGQIVMIDVGAVGYLDTATREMVTDFYLAMMAGKEEEAAVAMVDVCGESLGNVNTSRLSLDLRDFLDYQDLRRKGVDLDKGINQKVVDILLRNDLNPPSSYVLLDRTMLHVEGVARSLDPDIDYMTLASKNMGMVARERLIPDREPLQALLTAREYADFMRELPSRMDRILTKVENDKLGVTVSLPWIDELKNQVRKGALMACISMFVVALIGYLAWAGEKLEIPLIGLQVGIPLIFGVWVYALWFIWKRM
jgi:ubiquinone biosynthesis protein